MFADQQQMASFEVDDAQIAIPPPKRVASPASISSVSEDEDEIALFPPQSNDDVQPDLIDSLVAKEMSALSMQDREKVYYDVHGVSGGTEETPVVLQTSLRQMELELDKLQNIQAYETALSMDPNYVQNETFRLKFLRADALDPAKAALRTARHFQSKLELFGRDLLVKDIVQDDLGNETMQVLYDGSGQDLPERDRAGRLIVLSLLHAMDISVEAKLRRVFYGTMVRAEDEETQRKGCVGISYLVGSRLSFVKMAHSREWNSRLSSLLQALPIRYEALHLCHDSFTWRPIFAVFKFAATMFTRVRIREHYGDHSECVFRLQTFGIPCDVIPVSKDGTINIKTAKERWEKRRNLEQLRLKRQELQLEQTKKEGAIQKPPLPAQPVRVGTPGRDDVLLGRGKAFYQHVGNVRLRNVIVTRSEEYEDAGFVEKQRIGGEIVALIKESKGRFLKEDGAGWVEVEDAVAKKKVSHAFRTLRGVRNSTSASNKEPHKDASETGSKGTKRSRTSD